MSFGDATYDLNRRLDKLITAIAMRFINVAPQAVDSAVGDALRLLSEQTGASHAVVFERDISKFVMRITALWPPQTEAYVNVRSYPRDIFAWLLESLGNRRWYRWDDENPAPPQCAELKSALSRFGPRTLIAIPLRADTEVTGVVLFTQAEDATSTWTDETARLFSIGGEILSNAMQQKHIQEALRDSEARYRTLIESLGEGILFCDRDDRIIQINSRMAEISGFSEEEMIGRVSYELLLPPGEGYQLRDRTLRRLTGVSERYEVNLQRKGGERFWAEITATPIRNAEGEIIGTLGAIADISERKRAEQALVYQQQFLREVIDTVPNLIFVKDARLRFSLVNLAFAQSYGLPVEAILGKSDEEIHPNRAEAIEFAQECREVLHTGQTHVVVERLTSVPRSGEPIWYSIIRRPLRAPDGSSQVLSVGMDISERKKAEEESLALHRQLLQSQKMEAIGQLAAGVAHDLNNALGAVVGHLQLLHRSGGIESGVRESIEIALKGCERALSLIDQLLGFSRQGRYNVSHVTLRKVVEETVSFLSKVIGKDISILIAGRDDKRTVLIDIGQVQQALTNLIINAKQAMNGGGTISFAIDQECVSHPEKFNPAAQPGTFLTLSVKDTGCGIAAEHLDKVFEPFFTTKGTSGGSGLGLAMVYGIMQNHGGWIVVSSEVGRGTEFRLYFPEALPAPAEDSSLPPEIQPRTSAGTILVIDDEEILVDLTKRFLELAGLRSMGFSRTPEALAWYKQNWQDVDLVVIDMKMPEIDGPQCFSELRAINPDARVVVLSGYIQDASAQDLLSRGALRFFQKPLKYPELVQWISEFVGRARSSC